MARDHRGTALETLTHQAPAASNSEVRSIREAGCLLSRPGLWGLLLFLLISCGAFYFRDVNLFAMASEPLRQVLGYPPPAFLVSIALAVYTFSAMVLTLTAISEQARPVRQWNHLGYRVAFYLFYAFSGSIGTHFLAVLLIGVALYALDLCHVWVYAVRCDRTPESLSERL